MPHQPLNHRANTLIPLSTALLIICLVAACAGPAPSITNTTTQSGSGDAGERSSGPKVITAAIQSDPGILNSWVNPPGAGVPGLDVLESLVSSGLAIPNDRGVQLPLLADAVPSLENGLWKVMPDGRMETTWNIRPGAAWHDGTPFSSSDLEFTARVQMEKIVDVRPLPGFDAIESIATPDARTVIVSWKRPFIFADALWNAPPLPKHLLEDLYVQDKAAFGASGYWTQDFVGTGPFKVRQYVAGSHVTIDANEGYVLGRPKLDGMEVKFLPDAGALVANVLAGTVQLTLGRNLSVDQAIEARDQWRDGKMEVALSGWIVVFPQFIDANPAVVTNLQFRRALMHGIDRQQMADTLMTGLVPVAHAFLASDGDLYKAIEPDVVKYDFDQRRATAMIQELGYTKGADGIFRDSSDQPLGVEIRASASRDLNQKAILAIAALWQQLGLNAEPHVIPPQRARDREYVQTFPGFILYNQPTDLNSLLRHRGSNTPLPSNNYVGDNNSRYMNPEFDALIERFFSTIPTQERRAALGRVVNHMTANLTVLPMFYNAETGLVANRLQNASGRRGEGASQTWNVLQWDVAPR